MARPAVQLANAESIFPHLLARAWARRGLESVIVSATPPRRLPPEAGTAAIVDASIGGSRIGLAGRRAAKALLTAARGLRPESNEAFRAQTGLAAPQPWERFLVPHIVNGIRVAGAARRLSPLFVLGHEVVAYGYATARCRGVPRVLFPWGADVMTTAEVSRWHFRLVRHALRSADLIIPSSTTAARHIQRRFGIDADRVRAISWGADLTRFERASESSRDRICARWEIPPQRKIVMNVRRFLPLYNCDIAIRAFLEVARTHEDVHFVLLGGLDTESFVEAAEREVAAAGDGIARRFTFLRSNIPLDDCADLMSVADVAVSLCGRGDMRSRSVLEAAAAGCGLVVTGTDEYSAMADAGFEAAFVGPDDPQGVARAIREWLDGTRSRPAAAERNRQYLQAHEDAERQMDVLLDAILALLPPGARPGGR